MLLDSCSSFLGGWEDDLRVLEILGTSEKWCIKMYQPDGEV